MQKLKRSADPYLKGRTRMPFDVPTSRRGDVGEGLKDVMEEEWGGKKQVKMMPDKYMKGQAQQMAEKRMPPRVMDPLDAKLTKDQYPQRNFKKGGVVKKGKK